MKAARPFCVGILFGAISMMAAIPARAADEPFSAHLWDQAITLPPCAYRAGKAIELQGSFGVTTSPWTMLDGISFNGTQSGQQWHLSGTILQRVNINGQLGISMDAKDCVFENCSLSKGGGWFVSWWGSNWEFHNCIFTQKFIGSDLPPGDYSVRAYDCTFYDAKLPTIGLRDDPASYLQKDHLRFVNCHFVRCDVPESFLAATVKCVFEDCHFPSKRINWPAQTSSLAADAMCAGLSDPPDSFLNGPFSARFSEAPMNVQSGSTLQYSQTGDEITLNAYNPPLEYTDIGTIPKRSSQIIPSGANATGLSLPPAAGDGQGKKDVHSLDDIVGSLPQSINLMTDVGPDVDGIASANQWFGSQMAGRSATLQIEYGTGQTSSDPGVAYRVTSSNEAILCRGATLTGHTVCLFPAGSSAALSGIGQGDDLKVRGVVKEVKIVGHGNDLDLRVTLENTAVQ